MLGRRSNGCLLRCCQLRLGDSLNCSVNFIRSQHRKLAPTTACFMQVSQLSTDESYKSVVSTSNTTPPSVPVPVIRKRNTKIIQLDPSEYVDTCIGMKKLSLMERRGEPASMASLLKFRLDNTPGKLVDDIARHQNEVDLRPSALKRLWESAGAELEIKEQLFKQERVAVLGRDLGAAHFIVARKGRIRFMGHSDWISQYRADMEPGVVEEDLPMMTQGLCALPVRYDPNFRVEAMDASGIPIRYEGLLNFAGLNYLKWVSFRNNKFLDDWCLDRIYCNHGETVEYLDVSGCSGITLSGLSGLWRLKNLNTLVVKNLPHIKNLEILCATLEDQIPGLVCIGVDYEKKLIEMRTEAAELEKKMKEEAEAIEANTVEIVPRNTLAERSDTSESNVRQTPEPRSQAGKS